jgi:hypothetical protein
MKNLLIILSILISSVGYSQTLTDTINWDNPNLDLLDSLLFEKINEYRVDNGVNKLSKSDFLMTSSRDWSEKLSETDELTHDYSINCVENCGKTLYTTETIITYDDIVGEVLGMWVKSNNHNKNLLLMSPLNGGVGNIFTITNLPYKSKINISGVMTDYEVMLDFICITSTFRSTSH